MRHVDEDPTACPCRPTRVGPSGRDEWIHHGARPHPRLQNALQIFRRIFQALHRR